MKMLQNVTFEPAERSTSINDVLNFIRTANSIERRVIEIRLHDSGSMLFRKMPSLSKRLKARLKFAWFKLSYVFIRDISNKLFYFRSFRIVSLPLKLRTELLEYCNKANYNVLDIQFVREEFDYFAMLHKGQKTYLGYFIADNILD